MNIHPAMQSWADMQKQARNARTLAQAYTASIKSQCSAKLLNAQRTQEQAARQKGGAA